MSTGFLRHHIRGWQCRRERGRARERGREGGERARASDRGGKRKRAERRGTAQHGAAQHSTARRGTARHRTARPPPRHPARLRAAGAPAPPLRRQTMPQRARRHTQPPGGHADCPLPRRPAGPSAGPGTAAGSGRLSAAPPPGFRKPYGRAQVLGVRERPGGWGVTES